jgi:hypothetical protein
MVDAENFAIHPHHVATASLPLAQSQPFQSWHVVASNLG